MTEPTRNRPRRPRARLASLCGALLLVVALAACAAQSSSRYTPPTAAAVPSERIVEASRETTRTRLIQALTADGLVLNEVSDGGPVLLFMLETDDPGPYADCGRAHHDYTSPRGEEEAADFPVAERAQYKAAGAEGEPLRITQRPRLQANARVVLTALGERTRVAVETSYRLAITEVTQPLDRDGRPVGQVSQTTTAVRFASDKPAPPRDGRPGCAASGALERRILEAAGG